MALGATSLKESSESSGPSRFFLRYFSSTERSITVEAKWLLFLVRIIRLAW